MKHIFAIVSLVFTLTAVQAEEPMMWVRVELPTGVHMLPEDLKKFNHTHFEGLPENVLDLVVPRDEFERINASGMQASIISEDYYTTVAALTDKYFNYDEAINFMDSLRSAYPNLVKIDSIGYTHQGRAIWCAKIAADVTIDNPDKPGALFVGLHHSNELASMDAVLRFMEYLLTEQARDNATITSLLSGRQLWFIPVLNPDGLAHVHATQNIFWRKNARNNGGGSFGVDLNRNYGYMWDSEGSTTDSSKWNYRGPAPFSEPETQAVRNFMEGSGSENRRILTALSYHMIVRDTDLTLPPNVFDQGNDPRLDIFTLLGDSIAAIQGYDYDDINDVGYIAAGRFADWMYYSQSARPSTFTFAIEWPLPAVTVDAFMQFPLEEYADRYAKVNVYMAEVAGKIDSLTSTFVQNDGWLVFTPSNSILPEVRVRSIQVDSNNHLWVGTVNGLFHYDGENWQEFNTQNSDIPDNNVRTIAVDKKSGSVWIGTESFGLANFDGFFWNSYSSINSELSLAQIEALTADPDSGVWIGTPDGLAFFDGTNGSVFTPSNSGLPSGRIGSITIDDDGGKWIGIKNAGLTYFSGTDWTVYDSPEYGVTDTYIWAIVIDQAGTKWIGTGSTGLIKFDGLNWTHYNPNNSQLPEYWVRSIAIDKNEKMWIGCGIEFDPVPEHGGLAVFNGIDWTVFKTSNSYLPDNDISAIAIDGFGRKWIGTAKGLAMYSGDDSTVDIGPDYFHGGPNTGRLFQNYPNPFNPSTTISYQLPSPTHVALSVYDITGRWIRTLREGEQAAGSYNILWDGLDDSGSQVSTGVYLCRLDAGDYSKTIKMVYLK